MAVATDIDAGTFLLRHLERFGPLASPAATAICDLVADAPIRTMHARSDIINEGDRPRVLYVIQSGWAARYKTLPDGRLQILSFLIPGDFCDLDNHLLGQMDHTIGAITAVRVAEVAHDDVEEISDRFPELDRHLRKQMLVSVSVQREWTLNVGQRSALERLAHLFCEMMLRLRSVGLARRESFDFPLTQADLGDALGLTSVHVNRTLQQLRATGLVSLSGRVLSIPHFAALARAAHFTSGYLHLGENGEPIAAPTVQPAMHV